MKEKTITFCQINGNLNHNNKNINSNITFIQQSLEETYQQIFQKSIERYNIKQNSISQALREMGYTQGKESINQWRINERTILKEICANHNIQIKQTTTKKDFFQLEEKYQQSILELSTLKQQLTQMYQALKWFIEDNSSTNLQYTVSVS